MKRIATALLVCVATAASALACTSILVGKNASADGSVMCTYNIDTWGGYHPMYRFEAGKHPEGTMRKIYDRG